MKASEIRHWFDAIILSPEGAIIRIPCDTVAEVDSARSQFYRERINYVKKLGSKSKDIGIRRLTVGAALVEHFGGKHFVVLTVGSKRKQAVMVGADGVETNLPPFVEVDDTPVAQVEAHLADLTTEAIRHYDLMIEDGHSEKEAMAGALLFEAQGES